VDLAYCSVNGSFELVGNLMVTDTQTNYLGGFLHGGSSVTYSPLPPHWTINDTMAIENIMNLMCQKSFAEEMGLPPVKIPPLPGNPKAFQTLV
jgi:hypothetical protein